MNQDQLIRFLIDNLDADAFSAAKRDGTSIMYLAGVAQRMTGVNLNQPAARQTRPAARNAVAQETPQPVQDLNEEQPPTPTTPAAAARPAQRNTPVRNNTINQQDRVRVSAL